MALQAFTSIFLGESQVSAKTQGSYELSLCLCGPCVKGPWGSMGRAGPQQTYSKIILLISDL